MSVFMLNLTKEEFEHGDPCIPSNCTYFELIIAYVIPGQRCRQVDNDQATDRRDGAVRGYSVEAPQHPRSLRCPARIPSRGTGAF